MHIQIGLCAYIHTYIYINVYYVSRGLRTAGAEVIASCCCCCWLGVVSASYRRVTSFMQWRSCWRPYCWWMGRRLKPFILCATTPSGKCWQSAMAALVRNCNERIGRFCHKMLTPVAVVTVSGHYGCYC